MAAFSRFLAKEKKTEVEELFSEIQEESKLFEEFLRLHEEKINYVKNILPEWNEGDIHRIDLIIDKILGLNRKLWTLINQIFQIEKKERALFYFILKEKMNQLDRKYAVYKRQRDLLDKRKYQQYAKELDPYFEQLFDFLKSLSKLILLQINSIKGWGKSASARLAKDLIEREFFYNLLVDEASLDRKIKQHLVFIIRTINQFLGYRKKFGVKTKVFETPTGRKEEITSGVVFYKLRDITSINFERFYTLYLESFPPSERESKGALKSYLNYVHLKLNIKEDATRNHLVVGIVNGELIAATFFGTYLVKDKQIKKFLFGVTWWTLVSKEYRGKRIASLLYNEREKIMQRDARPFGVDSLDAAFTEVDDPKKMTQEQIREQIEGGINPFDRIKFQERLGFLQMKFDYIQPALDVSEEPVEYSMLMIKPFRGEWIKNQGIPLIDMKLIFWYFVRYGFDRKPGGIYSSPEKDPTYLKILENMEKSQIKGYVKFGPWS